MLIILTYYVVIVIVSTLLALEVLKLKTLKIHCSLPGLLGSYSQDTSNYGPSRGILQDNTSPAVCSTAGTPYAGYNSAAVAPLGIVCMHSDDRHQTIVKPTVHASDIVRLIPNTRGRSLAGRLTSFFQ